MTSFVEIALRSQYPGHKDNTMSPSWICLECGRATRPRQWWCRRAGGMRCTPRGRSNAVLLCASTPTHGQRAQRRLRRSRRRPQACYPWLPGCNLGMGLQAGGNHSARTPQSGRGDIATCTKGPTATTTGPSWRARQCRDNPTPPARQFRCGHTEDLAGAINLNAEYASIYRNACNIFSQGSSRSIEMLQG